MLNLSLVSLVAFGAGAALGVPTAYGMSDTGTMSIQTAPTPSLRDAPISDASDDPADSEREIDRDDDGFFYVRIAAGTESLRCMIDTGASGITMSSRQARTLGMATGRLRYNGRVVTAGGDRMAARGMLDTVSVAGRPFKNVSMIVVRDAHMPCLMGQEMIARLNKVVIDGDRMLLG